MKNNSKGFGFRVSGCRLLSLCFLGAVACGPGAPPEGTTDSDSGSDSDSSTSAGQLPPLENTECGEDVPEGWRLQCWADSSFMKYSFNNDENVAEFIWDPVAGQPNDEFVPTPCCGGSVSEATADDACADQCQRLVCEAAQSHHMDLADNMKGWNLCSPKSTCGFDMEACLNGTWHKQRIQFVASFDDYWLQAKCNGARTNTVFDNGIPAWNDDDPTGGGTPPSEPPMCAGAASVANDPGVVLSDDQAMEDAGTIATVTWTMLGSTAVEASNAPAVAASISRSSV